MSVTGTNEDEIRDALDAVAKNYKPPTRPRFATLLPFKRQIEFLRSQKASFRMIAKLLEPHSVQTSRETVRRFYHDIIEGLPPKQRQKRRRTKAGPKRKLRKTKTAMQFIPISHGQPRIARIEDL